jgi:hypothetical protein
MSERAFTALITALILALLASGCTFPASAPAGPTVEPSATTVLTLFFGNTEMNPGILDCSKVFPVERAVPAGPEPAEAPLLYLFAGPTEEEGYEWVQLGCSADNDFCDRSPFADNKG